MVLLVRDAFWLQAWWDLTRQGMDRAKAAMAEQWHTATPVIRLIGVEGGGTSSSTERVIRDIPIHGGVKTWYIDVKESPKSYRVDIGFLATSGKFFSLVRSNSVTTPRPSKGRMVEEDWSDIAENCEKIYALTGGYTEESNPGEIQELLEERLGRPVGSPAGSRYGVGAEKMLNRQRGLEFAVDAEMIIYGTAKPNSYVTLAGTPVKLRPDGSFSARISMPDRRQVLPIAATSADGVEQQTVVLAIERNTKVMEPLIRELVGAEYVGRPAISAKVIEPRVDESEFAPDAKTVEQEKIANEIAVLFEKSTEVIRDISASVEGVTRQTSRLANDYERATE